jgi:hypothetical protein
MHNREKSVAEALKFAGRFISAHYPEAAATSTLHSPIFFFVRQAIGAQPAKQLQKR